MSDCVRCKDCRYWGVVGTFTLPDGTVHEFPEPIFMSGEKQCLRLEEATDQDGGNAHLGTPPDFGCVLGERIVADE